MNKINFSDTEGFLLDLMSIGQKFTFNQINYEILNSAKPTVSKGECKTDVYALCRNSTDNTYKEFKISVKQANTDFIENKINLERAEELFGENAQNIMYKSIMDIKDSFEKDYLICFSKNGRTEAKTIKLGWKFELLNKKSGEKSSKINLTDEQKINVYSGNKMDINKKNTFINSDTLQ